MDKSVSKAGGPRVFMIDSVGAHRGMHYYNFALVSALNRLGAQALLISTDETAVHPLRPDNVPVWGRFKGIYGVGAKWLRGLRYAIALSRIGWRAWRERPDVAHFHFYQVPFLDYLLLRWLRWLGIKTVTTVHDVLPFALGEELAAARGGIYHRLYASSSALILHSRHIRDCLSDLDPALLERAALIPHGNYASMGREFLLPPQQTKAMLDLSPLSPVVLVFGTIKPNKRLDLVIEAIAQVKQQYPDARLVVAGKPQNQDVTVFQTLAQRLGVAENVLWRLEYVTDEALAVYFSAADVVVFPYQWVYQSGALLMAMNFGKPVVATAVGGNVETIKDGETGLLVPLDDVDAMAEAIQKLLRSQALALAIGEAAYAYVTAELSWDKIAGATLALYRGNDVMDVEV